MQAIQLWYMSYTEAQGYADDQQEYLSFKPIT